MFLPPSLPPSLPSYVSLDLGDGHFWCNGVWVEWARRGALCMADHITLFSTEHVRTETERDAASRTTRARASCPFWSMGRMRGRFLPNHLDESMSRRALPHQQEGTCNERKLDGLLSRVLRLRLYLTSPTDLATSSCQTLEMKWGDDTDTHSRRGWEGTEDSPTNSYSIGWVLVMWTAKT